AGKVRRAGSVAAWLYGTAHRIACQARAAAVRRRRLEAGAASRAAPGPARLAGPTDSTWREACAILHEELDRLPDRYRLPLVLCYLAGKSRDEAAQQLGWRLHAVKGRLERGRRRLRQRLARRGIELSVGLLAGLAVDPARAGGVPQELVRSTVGAAAAGTAPPAVAALARGVTHAMSVRRATLAVFAL